MKRKKRSKLRAAAEAGNWPVADPVPSVIHLLQRFAEFAAMTDVERTALVGDVRSILAAWNDHEDVNELRQMLGVTMAANRRRTQRQVNREYAIAFAFAEHHARGTSDPLATVMKEFACEKRTVERALEGWEQMATEKVRLMREGFERCEIDYSGLPGVRK